jgi:hypothetical protein
VDLALGRAVEERVAERRQLSRSRPPEYLTAKNPAVSNRMVWLSPVRLWMS